MEPHRRKDVPPRREPGQEPVPNPEDPAAHEQPPVDPVEEVYEQGGYDPGQALMDESPAYEEPSVEQQADPSAYVPPPPPVSGAGVYDTAPQQPVPQNTEPAPAPRRKPVVKRRPAGKRPATKRPYGRKRRPSYDSGGGMMAVFMTILGLGMLAVVIWAMLPKDLSGVQGYPFDPLAKTGQKNLLDPAQEVMISRNDALTLSEEEVNLYLNQRLQGEQSGLMASFVKYRGVYVDFEPEIAEVILEREIFGQPITMSAKIAVQHVRGLVKYRPVGWTIGRFEFTTRNIKPVVDMFVRLRQACGDEMGVLQQLADVRFEADKIVLDAKL